MDLGAKGEIVRTIAIAFSICFVATLATVIYAFHQISNIWGETGVAFASAFLAIAILVLLMALVFGGYGLIQQLIWGRATSSMAEATASTAKTMASVMKASRQSRPTEIEPEEWSWNTADGWDGSQASSLPVPAANRQSPMLAQPAPQYTWPDELTRSFHAETAEASEVFVR